MKKSKVTELLSTKVFVIILFLFYLPFCIYAVSDTRGQEPKTM